MTSRTDLSDFVSLLKFSGLWHLRGVEGTSSLWRWYPILRLFLLTQMSILWILSACLIGVEVFLKRYYSAAALTCPIILLQTIYLFCMSPHLQSFVVRTRTTMQKRKERWQIDIMNSFLDPLWKIVRFIIFICYLNVTVGFFAPILYDTVSTLILGAEPLTLVQPMEGLLSLDRKGLYYCMHWYNMILLYINTINFLGFAFVLPFLITYIRIEMKILCEKIKKWGLADHTEEEIIFHEIIEDHLNIIRMTESTNKLLAPPLVLQNLGAAVILTLVLNNVMNTIFQDSYNQIMFNLSAPFMMLMILFLPCYCGELLHSESLNIYTALCQIQWYNKPQERQKDLLIILISVQHPLTIHFKTYYFNLETFTQISVRTNKYHKSSSLKKPRHQGWVGSDGDKAPPSLTVVSQLSRLRSLSCGEICLGPVDGAGQEESSPPPYKPPPLPSSRPPPFRETHILLPPP